LTLLDGRIQRGNKEHLTTILVGKNEQSEDRGHRYLVIEGLAVELEKAREHFDVVSTTEINVIIIGVKL